MSDITEKQKVQIELKEKLRYETLKTLALQGKFSFVISLLNASVVFSVLSSVVENAILVTWLSLILGVTALRVITIAWFFRLDEDSPRLKLWRNLYLVLVWGSGLCWGILPLLDVFSTIAWVEAFIIFVIAGMSAGALVSLYAMLSAIIPYLVVILLPLFYVLAVGTLPSHYAMALLTAFFLLLMVRSAYTLNKAANKTMRLELENEELFDFLITTRNDAARDTGKSLEKGKFWEGYEI